MNPYARDQLAALLGCELTAVGFESVLAKVTPNARPYMLYRILDPKGVDVGERKPAKIVLGIGSEFFLHPTLLSARSWGDRQNDWVAASAA